jgi:anti-sigma B factor antagonist
MSLHQHVEVCESQGVTLIRFLDRQLVAGTDLMALWRELFLMIEDEGRNKLVLDFSLVDFLSSEALGGLIALRKRVTAKNGMLKLCCLCPEVLAIFAVTKLDGLFDIAKTVAEAFAAFA